MRPIVQYRWFYRDPVTGDARRTDYWATEEDMHTMRPDAIKIPWTRRVIEIPMIPAVLLAMRKSYGSHGVEEESPDPAVRPESG